MLAQVILLSITLFLPILALFYSSTVCNTFLFYSRSPGGTPQCTASKFGGSTESLRWETPGRLNSSEPLTQAFLRVMEQKFRNVRTPSPQLDRSTESILSTHSFSDASPWYFGFHLKGATPGAKTVSIWCLDFLGRVLFSSEMEGGVLIQTAVSHRVKHLLSSPCVTRPTYMP